MTCFGRRIVSPRDTMTTKGNGREREREKENMVSNIYNYKFPLIIIQR